MELEQQGGIARDTARRLAPVVRRIVDDYARAAPVELADEAALRFACYLSDASGRGASGAVRSETTTETVGPMTTTRTIDYTADHSGAFRRCGAAALLSPYRVRHGGVI
ncbi:MAG: hypothetical protein OXQ31_23110 [Spirochaetaceae bacterium]|nr:hypothetical protein [Spirochaetaceae bacterium]